MLDTILIANSGLASHQKGLRTISDNVANMNTPGFKGARVQFTDVFLADGGDPSSESARDRLPGGGVATQGTVINFSSGELRATGRSLDTAIDGSGFFVLKDATGHLYYTKNGRFQFDDMGKLMTTDQGYEVMGYGGSQSLTSLNNAGLKTDPPKPTSKVTFTGNVASQQDVVTVSDIEVFDSQGAKHNLSLELKRKSTIAISTWVVTIKRGGDTLLTGLEYIIETDGPDPTAAEVNLDLEADNGLVNTITFSLGSDVTSFSSGSSSTFKVASTDGYGVGTADQISFDSAGVLTVLFTNGESRQGGKLAIAEFAIPEALEQVSGTLYEVQRGTQVTYTTAGIGSTIRSGTLELSNIDLTSQFSDLVLIQRGYQASSQVLSTANEMIQQLFDMKGRR